MFPSLAGIPVAIKPWPPKGKAGWPVPLIFDFCICEKKGDLNFPVFQDNQNITCYRYHHEVGVSHGKVSFRAFIFDLTQYRINNNVSWIRLFVVTILPVFLMLTKGEISDEKDKVDIVCGTAFFYSV